MNRNMNPPSETEQGTGRRTVRATEREAGTDEPKKFWRAEREREWRRLQEDIR